MSDPENHRLGLWVEELHQDELAMRYRIKSTLFSRRSEFQQVDVVDSEAYGRMLFIDGLVMLSERDEFVYHEMISHVPMFVHPAVERVLVIGGGDGGTVREILRHPTVRSCRLVEIDGVVVDACREYIPQTASALGDPRVEVSIADGVKFVARTKERFDLVVIDSTDPFGPAEALFGPEFYANVKRVLNDDGVVVSQAESPFYNPDRQRSMLQILSGLFERAQIYNYSNLTYPGSLWSFSYASRSDRPPRGGLDAQRVERSGLSFRYYTADVHRAAFALPRFQIENLQPFLTQER